MNQTEATSSAKILTMSGSNDKPTWSDWYLHISKNRFIPVNNEIHQVSKVIDDSVLSPFHLQMIVALVINIRSQLAAQPLIPPTSGKRSISLMIARANVQYYLEQLSKAAELVAAKLYIIVRDREDVWSRYLQFLIFQLYVSITDFVKTTEGFQKTLKD